MFNKPARVLVPIITIYVIIMVRTYKMMLNLQLLSYYLNHYDRHTKDLKLENKYFSVIEKMK